jgi:hypothetical protein
MTLADEFAAIAKAAFIAGAISETKKLGTKAGKKTVRAVSDTAVAGGRKVKRKASQYSKRYGAAFKKIAKKYKKKDGSWKKDGFRNAQAAAHKLAKKGSTKKGQVRKTARRAYEK